MDIVDLAYQIIDMDRTIKDQAREIQRLAEYEDKYNKLLDSSMKHNDEMAGNMLKLLLTPGVAAAAEANNVFKENQTKYIKE